MKSILKTIFSIMIVVALGLTMFAQNNTTVNLISEATMTRNGSTMTVGMLFDFSSIKLKSTQAAVFVPMIVNGNDSMPLPEIGVYGRIRWYKFDRADRLPASFNNEIAIRYHKDLGKVPYKADVPYRDWMNGSELIMKYIDYGCANCRTMYINTHKILARYNDNSGIFEPRYIFKEAVAEVIKTRELSGKAYIDFPVGQTVILPDFRNNAFELTKIVSTIDSVRNDKDINVTSLSIKGFASPEGAYENNVRLAIGRTDALKEYVRRLYNFPYGFITTSYEPEDWEGLREWVLNSNINFKNAILDIIDSNLDPDSKNTKIQTSFPTEYKFLLDYVYPGLRRSDYKIEYTIRQFADIDEIAEMYRIAPQKLSLSEMYALASKFAPGSDNYNEIYNIAVRWYPEDETANLNAANAEMINGNLLEAGAYLEKAGESAEATYAKGILAALLGDRKKAETMFGWALFKGLKEAEEALDQLHNTTLPAEL